MIDHEQSTPDLLRYFTMVTTPCAIVAHKMLQSSLRSFSVVYLGS